MEKNSWDWYFFLKGYCETCDRRKTSQVKKCLASRLVGPFVAKRIGKKREVGK